MRGKMMILSIIVFAISGLWISHLYFLKEKDYDAYHQMVRERQLSSTPTYSSTKQHRKEVRKEIWATQDDLSRLHYRIESLSSIVSIIPVQNKFNLVESLSSIKSWMQDKLYLSAEKKEPMQQLRYMEADQGMYSYASQNFTAQNVSLYLFRSLGHKLPEQAMDKEKAFLKGIAKDLSFTISTKVPNLQAEQFKAQLNHE